MPLSKLVKVTVGNKIGFPDPLINPPDLGETIPVLDDIYEGSTISFDLTYMLYEISGESTVEYPLVTSVQLTSYSSGDIIGLSASKIGQNVIRVQGSPRQVFTDGYYKFLMNDGSIQILSSAPENFKTIVEWSIPTTRIKPLTHIIQTQVTDTGLSQTDSHTSTQTHDVYWRYEPALQEFRSLLARGTI